MARVAAHERKLHCNVINEGNEGPGAQVAEGDHGEQLAEHFQCIDECLLGGELANNWRRDTAIHWHGLHRAIREEDDNSRPLRDWSCNDASQPF